MEKYIISGWSVIDPSRSIPSDELNQYMCKKKPFVFILNLEFHRDFKTTRFVRYTGGDAIDTSDICAIYICFEDCLLRISNDRNANPGGNTFLVWFLNYFYGGANNFSNLYLKQPLTIFDKFYENDTEDVIKLKLALSG